jgi:hypothetical protein
MSYRKVDVDLDEGDQFVEENIGPSLAEQQAIIDSKCSQVRALISRYRHFNKML